MAVDVLLRQRRSKHSPSVALLDVAEPSNCGISSLSATRCLIRELFFQRPEILEYHSFDLVQILLVFDELRRLHVLLVHHECLGDHVVGFIAVILEDARGTMELSDYSHFLHLLVFDGYLR